MSRKRIFQIKINNWTAKNPKHKETYKSTMIRNNLCSDAKLRALPATHRWMFLGILLTCGDHAKDTIEMTERQLKDLLESSKSVVDALESLQSLQLLSYQETALIEVKKEEKRNKGKKEIPETSETKNKKPISDAASPDQVQEKLSIVDSPKIKNNPDLNRKVWEAYEESYLTRYKIKPVRNQTINSQISNLVKRLGEDSTEVVKFYLRHNDGQFVKNSHTIGLCLMRAEALHSEWQRGITITQTQVRDFEKTDAMTSQLRRIANGEL